MRAILLLLNLCFAATGVFSFAVAAPAPPSSSAAPQSTEEQELQKELETGIAENAVRAPFQRFLLIRQGAHCVALRVIEHPEPKPYRARYEWYSQDDGSMDFRKANVKYSSGEVYEKRASIDNTEKLIVKAGSFHLNWSASDWIYFPLTNLDSLINMAPTSWTRLQDVNAQSKSLRWTAGGNLVMWGPENEGLKLGACESFGQNYRIGGLASWHLLVRNVSHEPIKVLYYEPAFFDATPIVTDAIGRTVSVQGPVINAQVTESKKVLSPGETFDLCTFTLCLGSAPAGDSSWLTILKAPPGKYFLTLAYSLQNNDKDSWKGVLKSSVLPFTLRPARKP